MFDLGLQELILIFIVALLVFGPKRLPELGASIGKGLRQLKRSMFEVKAELDTELGDINKPPEDKQDKTHKPLEKQPDKEEKLNG